jgi:hypothetical protein
MRVFAGVGRCIFGLALIGVSLCLSTYLLAFALELAIGPSLLFVILAVVIVVSGSALIMAGATYFYQGASELL